MAIAATIVRETFVSAGIIIALVFMTAQLRRTALLKCIEHRKLVIIGTMLHTISRSETFYYGGYLKTGARHYLCP